MELKHFGVKGMKWGIRRKRGSDGRVSSSDYTEAYSLKKKHPRELSNEEIQKINRRLSLEADLRRLDPAARSAGKETVDKFVKNYRDKLIEAAAAGASLATIGLVKKYGPIATGRVAELIRKKFEG